MRSSENSTKVSDEENFDEIRTIFKPDFRVYTILDEVDCIREEPAVAQTPSTETETPVPIIAIPIID